MEPNLYCFPLAARMTNRYFAAVGFAGFAADHIEVAVVGTAAWIADTHSAGTDPTAAQVADIPAEEAVNH